MDWKRLANAGPLVERVRTMTAWVGVLTISCLLTSAAFAQPPHANGPKDPGPNVNPGPPPHANGNENPGPNGTPGPPPFMNKKQAVLMLTNPQGDVYTPGDFSVDVAVIRNNSPVMSYVFEVHYSKNPFLEMVGVEDVDLGGDPPGMDDEMTDIRSRYRLVGAAGNPENELANLTLCRINFKVNASSSDVELAALDFEAKNNPSSSDIIKIWLEETEDMITLMGTDEKEIPVFVDNRQTFPVRKRFRDRDRDGADDDRETDDHGLLNDISKGFTNRWLKDSDGDGLLDGQEAFGADTASTPVLAMTNPRKADTDGDGFSDGMEVLVLLSDPLDPNDPPADDPAFDDLDGDGLPAYLDEDDLDPDQDGDGFPDGYERQEGKNARDGDKKPKLGDVNGNGRADNLDAIMLFNNVIGNVGPLDAMENADVQSNGVINNLDAIVLFNWVLRNQEFIPHIIEDLPEE